MTRYKFVESWQQDIAPEIGRNRHIQRTAHHRVARDHGFMAVGKQLQRLLAVLKE